MTLHLLMINLYSHSLSLSLSLSLPLSLSPSLSLSLSLSLYTVTSWEFQCQIYQKSWIFTACGFTCLVFYCVIYLFYITFFIALFTSCIFDIVLFVPQLCFPHGVSLYEQPPDGEPTIFHPFIITREDGTKAYAAALTFFEKVRIVATRVMKLRGRQRINKPAVSHF